MADFKLQGITPAAGNIKLGSSNVSKIYSGSTQVWPTSACGECVGYCFEDQDELQDAVNLWTGTSAQRSEAISTYGQINTWCTGNVTEMNGLFANKNNFNDDISDWDVSNVTNMNSMFEGSNGAEPHLFNQDIGSWNVSNVTTMRRMFTGNFLQTNRFNKDISSWDVSNVTNMESMFRANTKFDQDISAKEVTVGGITYIAWDVSSVIDMKYMFRNTSDFNQNISNWCVTNISSEPSAFSQNSPLTQSNKPIWGTCPTV